MKENGISRVAKWHSIMTVVVAASMPLSKRLMPLFILLWVVLSAFLFRRAHARMGALALMSMATYYLLNLLWTPASDELSSAYFALEVKFSLLLFPVVWMFQPLSDLRQRLNVSLALVWGCIAFALISTIRALWLYWQGCDYGVFYYSRLAWFFHPTYLATYAAFALVVLGRLYIKRIYTLSNPLIHHLAAALLITHVALLSSKAGYLCVLLALALVAVLQWLKKRRVSALIYFASGSLLLAGVVSLAPEGQNRIDEVVQSGEALGEALDEGGVQAEHVVSSSGGRLAAWKSAYSIILAHPFGVGTGDVTEALKIEYLKNNFGYNYQREMNAHNQFFQAGVAFGWPGILCLLAIFYFGFRIAIQRKDFVFSAFLMLLFLNMLFESFLEVQSGVVFFAFFYGFFVKNPFPIRSSRKS